MYRVRIKTSPNGGTHKGTGQQEEYGLVRNLSAMQSAPQTTSVNNKMGAIPREQANIEVEGGESVIGDVNQDGTMELMHFVGKRHSEGGVPVNIPEGSFIFSDTKSLTIKDREVIEKLFNLPFKKQGYTPGEISKKYEINTYVEILKDENADPIAKRSAAEMLKKNKQKLGILAFIQESMKGFPDGIPAIAEDVLATMGIDPNQMAQQFAPPQPEQDMGMGMQQGMMPPMEGQGIPMSEDEDAMAGMMPEGPMVAPDQIPEQMMGRYGGTMLPRFEEGGFWDDMMSMVSSSMSTSNKSGCKSGYVWNPHVKECVTADFANVKDIFRIPEHAFQSNAQEWSYAPEPAPKKKETPAAKKAQSNFDKNFKVTNKPTAYEQSKNAQTQAIEEQRRKSGYYEKGKELQSLAKKIMEGEATAEEVARAKELNEAILGIKSDGTFTADRLAEEKIIYDVDKKYGTLSNEQIAKKKREEDAAKAKVEAEKAAAKSKADAEKAKADAEDRAKNPYKYSIPGFGSKSELDAYMESGSSEYAAGDIFYKALLSNDPYAMLDAADQIKNVDVPYSVGWLPWTNQDKIDDMYSTLHEEAYKKINETEKSKITTHYKVTDLVKRADDLISKYEKAAEEATDISTKKKYAEEVNKFKRYKDYINSDDHKDWRKETENSRVVNEDSWLPIPGIGNPIQDKAVISEDRWGPINMIFSDTESLFMNHGWDDIAQETDTWYQGPRFKTYFEIYDEITKAYDKENKTNISVIAPLGNKGLTQTNERQGILNWNRPEIIDNVKTIAEVQKKVNNNPTVAKTYNPEYKIDKYPETVFKVDKSSDGTAIWNQYFKDGATVPVSDANLVNELNAKATKIEGKPFAIKPAKEYKLDIEVEDFEQEKKLNPKIENTGVKSNTTPRKSVIAPVQPKKEQPKHNNGLTDDDFKLEFGGTIGEMKTINGRTFRYGGMIDEQGKLRYSRGGSVLPKYNKAGTVTTGPGDPPKEELVDGNFTTSNGTKAKKYKQVYTDPNGGPPTTIVVIRDAADETKILGRMNIETGESFKDDTVPITRASSTWITPDNLNDWEKTHIAERWGGNTQAYIDFQNSNNQIRLNKEFKEAIVKQYQEDVKDTERRMYTGQLRTTRDKFYDTKDVTGAAYSTGVEALASNPDEIINTMMNFERNNARLAAYGFDPSNSDQNVAASSTSTGRTDHQGSYVNEEARALIEKNKGLQDLDFSRNYLGQGTYISYRRALQNNAQFQTLAEHNQTGVNDETTFGLKGKVSGIDNYNTNTTLGERLGYKTKPPQPKPPGDKSTYYCVEYSDGTKMVQTVSYKEGEKPVEPSGDKVVKKTQYDTLELANANCEVPKKKEELIPPKEIPQPDTWFTPDVINLATGIRQRVPHPNAVLRQMPQIYSGYDLNNPITQIAGVTGLMRQQQDLAMNTMDPTVAFAASAGQGYDALAKGIAGIEEKNIDTVNNYLGRIGQLQAQYDAANMQGQRQFDVDSEVGKEEFARDLNKRDAQNALLYNTGWGNVQKDNALRVAYPNAWHANRITPDFGWSGVGRDPLAPDTSVTPGGSSSGQTDCAAVYTQAYNQVKNDSTRDEQAKKDYASRMEAACIQQNNAKANTQNKTQQQNYSGNLISNVKWSQFGGTYTAPTAYEFGGTYFDDF